MGYYLGVIVGTSMLRNALSGGILGGYSGIVSNALKSPGEVSPYALFNDDLIEALAGFACREPRCCAEASLVWAFINSGYRPLTVGFFSTDTNASELCAMTLSRCFSRHINVEGYVRVRFFGGDLLGGVANLVDALGRSIAGHVGRGLEAFIGIAGGTKLEVVSSVIVASLLGARLAYVSDEGKLVILPRMPLGLRREIEGALAGDPSTLPSGVIEDLVNLGLLKRGPSGVEVPDWLIGAIRGGRPSAQT